MKRFADSLGYLHRANTIVGRLEAKNFSGEDFKWLLYPLHSFLAKVKAEIGTRKEGLEHLRKCGD